MGREERGERGERGKGWRLRLEKDWGGIFRMDWWGGFCEIWRLVEF